MASKKCNCTWRDDQPGAVVFVLLVIALALLFPHDACRPKSDVEPNPVTVSADSDDTGTHEH